VTSRGQEVLPFDVLFSVALDNRPRRARMRKRSQKEWPKKQRYAETLSELGFRIGTLSGRGGIMVNTLRRWRDGESVPVRSTILLIARALEQIFAVPAAEWIEARDLSATLRGATRSYRWKRYDRVAECGTTSGYAKHIRDRTPVCGACRDGKKADSRQRLKAKKRAAGLPEPKTHKTDEAKAEIRTKYEIGLWTQRELAGEYRMTQAGIWGIVRGIVPAPHPLLSGNEVRQIRRMHTSERLTRQELGRIFSVSPSTISNVINYKRPYADI
jgi:transcriptional regulator with XRE-family HTH domain